jgi:sugar lactone lactonase YvrE
MQRIVVLLALIIASIHAKAQVYTGIIGGGATAGQIRNVVTSVSDAAGNVYVLDAVRSKVMKFSPTNNLLKEIGAPGQFCGLSAICASPNSNFIYISDLASTRIQKFNTDLDFQLTFAGTPATLTDCKSATYSSIVADSENNVYVLQGRDVKKFNANTGQSDFSWNAGPTTNTAFYRMCTNGEYIFTARNDGGWKIEKWNKTGGLVSTITLTNVPNQSQYVVYTMHADATHLYVAVDNAIQKFTVNGVFVSSTVFGGSHGMHIEKDGVVYKGSGADWRKYNFADQPQRSFGAPATEGQLQSVSSVAVDASGNTFVADQFNHYISKFAPTGTYIKRFGGPGSADGQLNRPLSIALDKSGNLYVADAGNNRVQKFDNNGTFISKFGSAGVDAGQFSVPRAIVVDVDFNIYVGDTRIQKFNSSGVFQSNFTAIQSPVVNGLMNDKSGNIYIQTNQVLIKVNRDGEVIASGGLPTSLSGLIVDNDGYIFYSTAGTTYINKATPTGSFLTAFGPKYPTITFGSETFNAMAVDGSNTIYVASNNYVRKYQSIHINSTSVNKSARGTSIKIQGSGFSETPTKQTVRIGSTAASITAATPTELTVTIPTTSITSKIEITRDSAKALSPNEFIVAPYAITQLVPGAIVPGDSLLVIGSGFSSVKGKNGVTLGGVVLATGTNTYNAIRAFIPPGSVAGKINVSTGTETASADLFITQLRIRSANVPNQYTVGSTEMIATIEVNDLALVKSAKVYSRSLSINGDPYKSATATATTENGLIKISIPASVFTDKLGHELYIALLDPNGVEVTTAGKNIRIGQPASATTLSSLKFGTGPNDYQLISIPLILTDNLAVNVFKELGAYDVKKWRLFGYQSGVTEMNKSESRIRPGVGYWFIARTQTDIHPGEGSSVDIPFYWTLAPGWNLIGNPFNFNVSWEDVKKVNPKMKALGDLRLFSNGTYTIGDVLPAFGGAFVKLDSAVQAIVIAPHEKKAGPGRKFTETPMPLDNDNWSVAMRVDDGVISNNLGGIGMNLKASDGSDRFDETELPAPEGLNTFQFQMNKIGQVIIQKDIVRTTPNYSWTGQITSANGVSLSWDNTYFGNNDKQLMIEVEDHAKVIDMRATSTLSLPKGLHRFHIHYGNTSYVEKMIVTEEPMVGEMSPNPIGPGELLRLPVSIPFGGGIVAVNLVDMTGRTYMLGTQTFSEGRKFFEVEGVAVSAGRGLFVAQVVVETQSVKKSFYRKVILR